MQQNVAQRILKEKLLPTLVLSSHLNRLVMNENYLQYFMAQAATRRKSTRSPSCTFALLLLVQQQ